MFYHCTFPRDTVNVCQYYIIIFPSLPSPPWSSTHLKNWFYTVCYCRSTWHTWCHLVDDPTGSILNLTTTTLVQKLHHLFFKIILKPSNISIQNGGWHSVYYNYRWWIKFDKIASKLHYKIWWILIWFTFGIIFATQLAHVMYIYVHVAIYI